MLVRRSPKIGRIDRGAGLPGTGECQTRPASVKQRAAPRGDAARAKCLGNKGDGWAVAPEAQPFDCSSCFCRMAAPRMSPRLAPLSDEP